VVGPLPLLRAYQQQALRAAFTERLAAPRAAVALTEQPVGTGGRLLFEAPNLPAEQTAAGSIGTIASEYLVARVGGERCGAVRVPVTLRYRSPDFHGDFSRTVSVVLATGASTSYLLNAALY